MTHVVGEVRESSSEPRVASSPLAHVSVELGHLYYEDFAAGPDALATMFESLAPWAAVAVGRMAAGQPHGSVRASTCFLVDDYFSQFSGPAEIVPMIVDAAAKANLRIDYLVRESACALADGVEIARLVERKLVQEPPRNTTGARPPVSESGWLSNGERSPAPVSEAMRRPEDWQPPRQNAARRHSIFVDVELWDEVDGERVWSCPMLSAVWQLLRLGLVRDAGRLVAVPADVPERWPEAWSELPPVVRLTPDAAPFAAYRTTSILSPRFLPVELAVRTILGQYVADARVVEDVGRRARSEGVQLAAELVDRIHYVFVNELAQADPA